MVLIFYDAHFSPNASVSRSACAGDLCAKMGARDHAHKWTARALSAAPICYVVTDQKEHLGENAAPTSYPSVTK